MYRKFRNMRVLEIIDIFKKQKLSDIQEHSGMVLYSETLKVHLIQEHRNSGTISSIQVTFFICRSIFITLTFWNMEVVLMYRKIQEHVT